jgi:hypothetical protein
MYMRGAAGCATDGFKILRDCPPKRRKRKKRVKEV